MAGRVDYGVDGYPYILGLLGGGALAVIGAIAATASRRPALGATLAVAGVVALVPGVLGVRYVRGGKEKHRDRLLSKITWRGDERILDVGTGGGLMLIGGAKRAPRGRAVGVDVWSSKDLSGNVRARAIANAKLAGVSDRIEVRDEDARRLSFADASFDVVLSTLCLHNIEEGRERAVREIARVLAPGGTVVVSDLAATEEVASLLRAEGLQVTLSGPVWDTFPFQRVVVARRPAV